MSFLFTCPHCNTKTKVDDQYRGKGGRCVTCGNSIEMPTGDAQTTAAAKRQVSRRHRSKDAKLVGIVAATAVCLLLLGLFLFSIIRFGGQTMTSLTSGRERVASMRNLERIAAAMNAYASDHGTYPPPMTTDSTGAPLHCWRVLILPYLNESELQDRINLNLSWDHPENRLVTDIDIPMVFRHPSRSQSGPAYFLITGIGTLFPPSGPLGPGDVTDDVSQTLLVVEGSPISPTMSWAEPVDLPLAMMQGNLAVPGGNEPGGLLDGGVAIATVDGRSHFIRNAIAPSGFLALATPTGGERLADDTLD